MAVVFYSDEDGKQSSWSFFCFVGNAGLRLAVRKSMT